MRRCTSHSKSPGVQLPEEAERIGLRRSLGRGGTARIGVWLVRIGGILSGRFGVSDLLDIQCNNYEFYSFFSWLLGVYSIEL